jgi:hypothetical protein
MHVDTGLRGWAGVRPARSLWKNYPVTVALDAMARLSARPDARGAEDWVIHGQVGEQRLTRRDMPRGRGLSSFRAYLRTIAAGHYGSEWVMCAKANFLWLAHDPKRPTQKTQSRAPLVLKENQMKTADIIIAVFAVRHADETAVADEVSLGR